jgi:hypothetical protein
MRPGIEIVVGIDNMGALMDAHQGDVMAALRHGALAAAQFAQGVWIQGAQAADVRHTGAYIQGITSAGSVRTVSETQGKETWEIVIDVVNTAPHAQIVEEGHAAFHLPSVVSWSSSRVKMSKKGVKYLHIAFSHTAYAGAGERASGGYTTAAVKAMMPEHIYEKAKRMSYTTRLHQGPVYGPGGQFKQADRYAYPKVRGRLDRSGTSPALIMGGPGVSAGGPGEPGYEEHRGARQVGRDRKGNALVNPAWKNSKFHGMMRGGSTGHSTYSTIRTMTDRSLGWNIPAQSGKYIAAKVATILSSDPRFPEVVVQQMAAFVTPGGP